ncbi:unnamed protein product [Cuscuta campestris]|uniref:Uncharacterized protein n=1 Tax=Cuscuta campestris TaxID=132261 RepID=A0A484LUL8_9ASTE|nr:unnamed protein product [Cuscuta campestris]
MELAAERSRVESLQEQIATYQRGTQDLEAQFHRLRAQISILESKASALEDKVGSLKAGLVERESRISELECSLQEAKQEGAHLNDLVVKHIEAKRLTLEKLGKERQTASELRSRMGELEKAIAAHQEEVSTLTARAEALYEEGKFDMQHCIYEAVQSGLPAYQSLDDFISHYGEENHPHLPQQASGGVLPGSGVLPNGTRTGVSSGCPGTSRPQKRRNPHSGTFRLVSGERPSSQGSPSPQQSYGQQPKKWGDNDMGEIGFRLYAGKRTEPSEIHLHLPYKRK